MLIFIAIQILWCANGMLLEAFVSIIDKTFLDIHHLFRSF